MKKRSPGPWSLVDYGGSPYYVSLPSHFCVAEVALREDARLIASAPEMLELLREFDETDLRHEEGHCMRCGHHVHRADCAVLKTDALLARIDPPAKDAK